MSERFIATLTDRALIEISGADREQFLQDLITNDLSALGNDNWLYASLLTPQGKILFDFFIARLGDKFFLDCASDARDDLIKRFGLYKLRADVAFSPTDTQWQLAAIWPDGLDFNKTESSKTEFCATDPRFGGLGQRCLLPQGDVTAIAAQNELNQSDLNHYHKHRIGLGIADSSDIGSGEHYVHECDLDQLNGVSFTKGCYIGQEVVSRIEHRSNARKRMIPVRLEDESVKPGSEISANGRVLGEIISQSGSHAIALIRLDLADEALKQGETLKADNIIVTPVKPAWANFDMPGIDK